MTATPGVLAARAHPFTPLALTLAIAVMAVALPGPGPTAALYAITVALAVVGGVGRAVFRAMVPLAPLWFFLLLLHGVLGEGPRTELLGVSLSRDGLTLALSQAARLGAIATASFALYAAFSPARLVDAVAARGWPFAAAYLVVATLLALPRFRSRATAILDAQRSRGLRLSGPPLQRLRALGPVTFPLLLGALAEVEERGFALETRCADGSARRTPLAPPQDHPLDLVARWGAALAALTVLAWRVLA